MSRLPISLQSFLILCAGSVLAILLNGLLHLLFSYPAGPWSFVFTQAAIAAGLSLFWRLPTWWIPLHAGFLPAVLLALQLDVPSWIYLAAFMLLLLFYWSSFRTRVPLYLSDRKAWEALAPLLPQSRPFSFIDLGSGLGDVLFFLEPRFPQGRLCGTEIAPAPWLISRARAWLKRSRVAFMRRDYASLDLAEFEVVFAFLSPAAMPALWQQAQAQMGRGGLFVSLSFLPDSRQPDHVVPLAEGERHTLYAWRM